MYFPKIIHSRVNSHLLFEQVLVYYEERQPPVISLSSTRIISGMLWLLQGIFKCKAIDQWRMFGVLCESSSWKNAVICTLSYHKQPEIPTAITGVLLIQIATNDRHVQSHL